MPSACTSVFDDPSRGPRSVQVSTRVPSRFDRSGNAQSEQSPSRALMWRRAILRLREAHQRHAAHRRPIDHPRLVAPCLEDGTAFDGSLQRPPVRPAPDGVGGDDQQRRILQRQCVLPELIEGCVEACPRAPVPGGRRACPCTPTRSSAASTRRPSRRRRCPCVRRARSSSARRWDRPRPASARRATGTDR